MKLNLESLNKDNDLDKFLPQILNIFRDLFVHWSSLNNKSKRNFNKLIFPEGITYSLEENIKTPQMSKFLKFIEKISSRKVIWWS